MNNSIDNFSENNYLSDEENMIFLNLSFEVKRIEIFKGEISTFKKDLNFKRISAIRNITCKSSFIKLLKTNFFKVVLKYFCISFQIIQLSECSENWINKVKTSNDEKFLHSYEVNSSFTFENIRTIFFKEQIPSFKELLLLSTHLVFTT